jgi:hypothetical protein
MGLTERLNRQLRFDVFKLFNQPKSGAPDNGLVSDHLDANGVPIPGSGGFGTVTSLNAGISTRDLQASAKLVS